MQNAEKNSENSCVARQASEIFLKIIDKSLTYKQIISVIYENLFCYQFDYE